MSGWTYLEKLRSQPEPIRRQIAFWASLLLTLLILAVWFLNSRIILGPVSPGAAEQKETSSFGQRVRAGWQTFVGRLR